MIGCFVLRSLCCPRPTRRHGETTTQGLVGALVGDVREARRYGMMVVLMLSRSTRMRRSGFLALALRLSTRPAPFRLLLLRFRFRFCCIQDSLPLLPTRVAVFHSYYPSLQRFLPPRLRSLCLYRLSDW